MNSNNIKQYQKMLIHPYNVRNILEEIKCKYILNQIFNNIQKNKYLEIIKYNKAAQYRLNININNYKEFSKLFTPIEIEIVPSDKKFGKFINIINEDEKYYYHIFLDNEKEEAERNYLNENDKISKIKIIIDYQINSFEHLFEDCTCIESIFFEKFYRNNINNMSYIFNGCSSLKNINFFKFNTDNVIYMDGIFRGCTSLKELNLAILILIMLLI